MIKSRKHVHHRFTPMSAALAAMLLPVVAQAAGPDAVVPADGSAVMQEIRIEGSRGNDFKADHASSPKYTEKLVDTAQSLSVIKKELIDQQGAVSLTEALSNTPGVGAFFLGENGSTNTGDAIYMRGFDTSSSIFVDGVRDVGSISRDTFNVEQIEVLKGPAGTDNGRSAPTGSVNLVSKQPTLINQYSGKVVLGSGQKKRATADLNTVIDSASGTAFRLNLLDQDSGRRWPRRGQEQTLGRGAGTGFWPEHRHPRLPEPAARQAEQHPGRRRADRRPARLHFAGPDPSLPEQCQAGRSAQLLRLDAGLRPRQGRHVHRAHRTRLCQRRPSAEHQPLRQDHGKNTC